MINMKYVFLFLIILIMYLNSCNIFNNNQQDCSEGFLFQLIGKSYIEAKYILEDNFYIIEHEVYSEGESWPALYCYLDTNNNKPDILVETSWINKKEIHRINIFEETVSLHHGNVKVGMYFNDVKKFVSSKLPSSPDGYFFLKDKKCLNVHYLMTINDKDSIFYYGKISNLKDVPKEAIVEMIIITQQNK